MHDRELAYHGHPGTGDRVIFDVLGVTEFLRARYGDALVEDVVESHIRNAPNDFTVVEVKLLISKRSMVKTSEDGADDGPCGCPSCPLHTGRKGS